MCMWNLIQLSLQLYDGGTSISLILKMKQLRPREVNVFAAGDEAGWWK